MSKEFIEFCNVYKRPGHEVIDNFNTAALANITHGAIGVSTEAGELLDIIKRRMIYSKPFCREHIIEEVGDILHYLTYIAEAMHFSFEDAMEANMRKIKVRYPNKFNTHDALNRNIVEEKEALGIIGE